jgi:hypothetical protein
MMISSLISQAGGCGCGPELDGRRLSRDADANGSINRSAMPHLIERRWLHARSA